jgi:asparagine synthase (glutamine-hydrolysing)
MPLSLSSAALWRLLSLNYLPEGESLVEEIVQVPAGGIVSCLLDGQEKKCVVRRYWTPREHARSVSVRHDYPRACAAAECVRVGERVLERRSMASVPFGMFLSGGTDSALLAHLLRRGGFQIPAFIAHFADARFDESTHAVAMAHATGMNPRVVPISLPASEDPSLLYAIARAGDTPLADSSSLAVIQLAAAAAREVKVVLTGDGADELFGGYLTYQATILGKKIPYSLARIIAPLHRFLSFHHEMTPGKVSSHEKVTRFLATLPLLPGARHAAWNGTWRHDEKMFLFSSDFLASLWRGQPVETFGEVTLRHGIDSHNPDYRSLLLADQETYLPYDILEKVDRMTMAHGVEARPFYTDEEFATFSYSLPEASLTKKQVLRDALLLLDPHYRYRKKEGFSIPVHSLFRGPLRGFMNDLIASCEQRLGGALSHKGLNAAWQRHLSGKTQLGFHLWGVMMAMVWEDEVWNNF